MKFLSALFAFIALLANSAHSQDIRPPVFAELLASAPDIKEAGDIVTKIEVRGLHWNRVEEKSLDDSDLWITNSSGFFSKVKFVEYKTWNSRPNQEGDFWIQSVATYELAAPEGGWTEKYNGEFAIMLAGGEYLRANGSTLPLALLGSFKVSIGDEVEPKIIPAIEAGVTVETFATPGAPGGNRSELAIATVTASFPVEVAADWGELEINDDGTFCINVSGFVPVNTRPPVSTTHTRRFELGMLDPGKYSIVVKSLEERLAKEQFNVGGNQGELIEAAPTDVSIKIVQTPSRGLYPTFAAKIKLTYGGFVVDTKWGKVKRDGEIISSNVTTLIDPRILVIAPVVVEHEIFLGSFRPGKYLYQLTSLDEVIGAEDFEATDETNRDFRPPTIKVQGAKVNEPGEEALKFSVIFSDESELVPDGIKAQVLTAMDRRGEVYPIELVDLQFTADASVEALATYRMEAPGGSWGAEDRGRYRLLLSEPELVCDLVGNHLRQPNIGYLKVDISEEEPEPKNRTELKIVQNEDIGRWTAKVRLLVPGSLAPRDDWDVNWGEVRPSGMAFFLNPKFVRAGSDEEIDRLLPPENDPEEGAAWIEHDYDLGPVSNGFWLVCVQSNLGHFAKAQLLAGSEDGEEAAKDPFDFWQGLFGRQNSQFNPHDLWEYCVGTDPNDPTDDHLGDPKPEVIDGEEGKKHLGLRCRISSNAIDARLRFEGSIDMKTWIQLGPDDIEEIERVTAEGGIEEFVICLRKDLEESDLKYLRAVAERW